jgi:hypothetical protein
LSGGDFPALLLILYLTSLGGIAMGLFCSALVNSTEKAMSILPLILIPQLLLSGFLKPVDDLYVNTADGKATTAAEYRRYEDSKSQTASRAGQMTKPLAPVTRHEGLGAAKWAADLMIARWSVEALVHAVSIEDEKARHNLAARMTVAGYDSVLRQQTERSIEEAYRSRVLIDSAILAGFPILFLILTMWALRRKDTL